MKKAFFLLAFTLLSGIIFAQNEKPKMVVGIVVDQLKQEYLWRFENHFLEDGLRRLMVEGFVAKNAHYNYSMTNTGPGHASIYTGTTPAHHGIVSNSWYNRGMGKSLYCAEDSTVQAVGGSIRNGLISPANLYSSTITDEIKWATQKQAKVIAMSIKDRGAALPGGHLSDGSYWYDSATGNMMTSTYYMSELPEWVKNFNARQWPNQYLNGSWSPSKDLSLYKESGDDDSPYERGFRGKDTPTLPYNLSELRKTNGNLGMLPNTPFGNSLITEFALSAIEAEQMGEDNITDFIAISYSSPDYIGHNFGPQSKEVQDTYIKLDAELSRLFNALDQKIGKGNYLVFLSSDHGVAENSIRMKNEAFRIDNLDSKAFGQYIESATKARFGDAEWFEVSSGLDLFLNHDVVEAQGIDLYDIQLFVAQKAMQYPGVHYALTGTDLLRQSYDQHIPSLIQMAYHPKESGDVKLVMQPGWQGYGGKGTGHGSPWTYDTHIPIMFYGWGVQPGSTVRKINITDIAPTLSMMLDIRLPNAATGQPIMEIFEK